MNVLWFTIQRVKQELQYSDQLHKVARSFNWWYYLKKKENIKYCIYLFGQEREPYISSVLLPKKTPNPWVH